MNEEKHNKIVIGTIILLLVLSIGAIVIYQKIQQSKQTFTYNGFTVAKEENDGLTSYQIQFFKEGTEQPFIINSRYNPKSLENISIAADIRDLIVKEKLYITMAPTLSGKGTVAFAEIDKYTENPFLFNLPTSPALLQKVEGNELPLMTCEGVSPVTSVIKFNIGDQTRIYEDNGCVIIQATNEDELIRAADRLSLTLLGIMKE